MPLSAFERLLRLQILLFPLSILASVALAAAAYAHVHRSADGTVVRWYPNDCCNNGDCHPVTRVQAQAGGFLLTTDEGDTVFVSSKMTRRPSLDNRWHICFGSSEAPVVRCIFEPASS